MSEVRVAGDDIIGEEVRRILDLMPDGIVVVRGDGTIVHASARAEQLLGFDPGALEGLPIESLVPRSERDEHARRREKYAEKPIPRPMGTPLNLMAIKADGTEVPVDIALSPLVGESEPLVLAAIRDITKIKRAQEELAASEHRLRVLVEAAEQLRAASTEPDDVMAAAARLGVEVIGDGCAVHLVDDTGEWLDSAQLAHRHPDGERLLHLVASHRMRVGTGVAGRVAATGESMVVGPIATEILRRDVPESYWPFLEKFPVSCVLAVPMRISGKIIGAMAIGRGVPYSSSDVELAEALAARVSLAIERVRLLEGVNATAAQLDSMFEKAAIGMLFEDFEGRILRANRAFADMVGRQESELTGIHFSELTHPDDRHIDRETVSLFRSGKVTQRQVTKRYLRPDGTVRWARVFVNVRPGGQRPSEMAAQVEDITESRRLSESLAESEHRLRQMMSESPIGMALVDLSSHVVEVNRALCDMLGYSESELLALTLPDFVPSEARSSDQRDGRGPTGDLVTSASEVQLVRADGAELWAQCSVTLLRDERDAPSTYMVHLQDVTQARHALKDLEFRAHHDLMTGTLSRESGIDALAAVLRRNPTGGMPIAAMYCDVDNFKKINDIHGHAAGDQVLREVSDRIATSLRGGDVIARFGGDELFVLLTGIRAPEDALVLAEKVRAAVARPIDTPTARVGASMSIGLCVAPPGSEPDAVLRAADEALYEAKNAGRNRVCLRDLRTDAAEGTG